MSLAYFGKSLRWRKQPQQPPVPCVEDEIDSLSRELDGLSHAGELPGHEGAKARGTVNQSILIEDNDVSNFRKTSSHAEERLPQGYYPSGFNANCFNPRKDTSGPKKARQPAGDSPIPEPGKPSHRSPSRSQEVPRANQPSKATHTQVPEPPKSIPLPTQKPVFRQSEPALAASGSREDAVPPKIPSKPMHEMSQKSRSSPSRNPSLHRTSDQHKNDSSVRYAQPESARHVGARTSSPVKSASNLTEKTQSLNLLPRAQEQHRLSSPTRYSHPELVRNTVGKMALPAEPMPERNEKDHTGPSRIASQLRGQEKQKSCSPTRYAQPEAVRPEKSTLRVRERNQSAPPSRSPSQLGKPEQHKPDSHKRYDQPERVHSQVRASSSPRRIPEVMPQPQSVMPRSSSVGHGRDDHRSIANTISSLPAGYSGVPAGAYPSRQIPQSPPFRPLNVPQETQNRPMPTIPYQEAPIQDTYYGPFLPPKQVLEPIRQAQPSLPPLATSPDDEPYKPPRPFSVSFQPNLVGGDNGVRVEKLPSMSIPITPQNIQRSPPASSENVQYKSFSSSIGTPPPDTPPFTQANSFQSMPSPPLPNPSMERPHIPSSPTMEEPTSTNQAPPTKVTAADLQPNTDNGSGVTHQGHFSQPLNVSLTRPAEHDPPSSPSVAERLEEKIKLRREKRDYRDVPQSNSRTRADSLRDSSPPASQSPERRGRSTQPPGAWPSDSPPQSSSSRFTQFPRLEKSTGEAKPQAKPLKSAMRSHSLSRSRSASAKATRRRTVAFAEHPLEHPLEHPFQALVTVNNEAELAQKQTLEDDSDSGRFSSPSTGLTLSPCPRSVPVAGYQDWYTIEELNHLDICPSCVKQMRRSKFRDRIVLSTSSRTEPIRCAMSEPWIRLAWVQILKKKFETLDLLLEVTRPSNTQGTKSCTGRIVNEQYWYRVVDPDTGMYLPQFNVCSACVRNIRLLMPAHRETFQRSTAPQERVCDFVTDSPRFIRYIDALDLSSNRAEQDEETPDLKEFLAYTRRKVVLRDCRRSRLVFDKWHFMSQLPEFTVCEDCYDDIIWPLAKARHPIAREFSSVMRVLPAGAGSGSREGSREASCQLYSPRIRAKFNDAVRRDDLAFLKWMARTRYEAEQRFRDRQDELLEDQRRGYECSGDLRKNLEDWRRYE